VVVCGEEEGERENEDGVAAEFVRARAKYPCFMRKMSGNMSVSGGGARWGTCMACNLPAGVPCAMGHGGM